MLQNEGMGNFSNLLGLFLTLYWILVQWIVSLLLCFCLYYLQIIFLPRHNPKINRLKNMRSSNESPIDLHHPLDYHSWPKLRFVTAHLDPLSALTTWTPSCRFMLFFNVIQKIVIVTLYDIVVFTLAVRGISDRKTHLNGVYLSCQSFLGSPFIDGGNSI